MSRSTWLGARETVIGERRREDLHGGDDFRLVLCRPASTAPPARPNAPRCMSSRDPIHVARLWGGRSHSASTECTSPRIRLHHPTKAYRRWRRAVESCGALGPTVERKATLPWVASTHRGIQRTPVGQPCSCAWPGEEPADWPLGLLSVAECGRGLVADPVPHRDSASQLPVDDEVALSILRERVMRTRRRRTNLRPARDLRARRRGTSGWATVLAGAGGDRPW